MTTRELNSIHSQIEKDIENGNLFDAFGAILSKYPPKVIAKHSSDIEKHKTTYSYMLDYFYAGAEDPRRDDVLHSIALGLLGINDRIYEESSLENYSTYSGIKHGVSMVAELDLSLRIEALNSAIDVCAECKSSSGQSPQDEKCFEECDKCASFLFDCVLTTYPFSENDSRQIMNFYRSPVPRHFKELIVSALFVGACLYFDIEKIELLQSLYADRDLDNGIRMRALVALFFLLSRYKHRFPLYTRFNDRMKLMGDAPDFFPDLKLVVMQFLQCRDTERITKKLHDELMPEIMKLTSRSSKIKNFDMVSLEDLEANPEWQDRLKKSGISKKIQEFGEIQIEGGDILMSTFAKLKHFPFFNKLSNWFLPFYADNAECRKSMGRQSLADAIAGYVMMCNSDKYSFALTISSLPQQQREMIAGQLESQYTQIMEIQDSENNKNRADKKRYVLEYMQDLYRFSKLFPQRVEFDDLFASAPDIFGIPYISELAKDADTLNAIAQFYFKREYFRESSEMLERVIEVSTPTSELYEKLGFCNQNLKCFSKAVDCYEKALFFRENNAWTLRHLAFCHKISGNIEAALKCYSDAETLQPENVNILLNIGHINLELGKIEDALKYYYKVDYIDEKNHKAWRPIAWTEFVGSNYEQSKVYYDKIMGSGPNAQDYLNVGHLFLVQKNTKSAIDSYIESLKAKDYDFASFAVDFKSDMPLLIGKGISQSTLDLVIDAIKFKCASMLE